LELQCQNTSNKVIAAYVIRIDHLDQDGKVTVRESTMTITKDLGLSKGRPGYQPGERWVERMPVRVEAASRDVALDLVVYADGSHWGPDKARKLDHILGIKAGAQMERTP
jgi:hypothetical protein